MIFFTVATSLVFAHNRNHFVCICNEATQMVPLKTEIFVSERWEVPSQVSPSSSKEKGISVLQGTQMSILAMDVDSLVKIISSRLNNGIFCSWELTTVQLFSKYSVNDVQASAITFFANTCYHFQY